VPLNDRFVLQHVFHGVTNTAGTKSALPLASEEHPVSPESRMIIDHHCGSCKIPGAEHCRTMSREKIAAWKAYGGCLLERSL
jgi:hypothetical protein